MSRRYAYVVICLKESKSRWSVSFKSLGNSVPAEILQLPNLSQPLTSASCHKLDLNPVDYFRRIFRDMPEMLRSYRSRTIDRVRNNLNQLEIGQSCQVKVVYIDCGGGIASYNYNIDLLNDVSTDPYELDKTFNTDIKTKQEIVIEREKPTQDLIPPDNTPHQSENDYASVLMQLAQDFTELRADLESLKQQMVKWNSQPLENVETIENCVAMPDSDWSFESEELFDPEPRSPEITPAMSNPAGIQLSREESFILRYLSEHRVASESVLQTQCKIENPISVMTSLMVKVERGNLPQIFSKTDDDGEMIYIWDRQHHQQIEDKL